jgi:hypothetical protein
MCTSKQPKPQPVQTQAPNKPVQYLHNPWVDGLGIMGSATRGRNSLRIDPGSTPRVPVTTTPPTGTPYGTVDNPGYIPGDPSKPGIFSTNRSSIGGLLNNVDVQSGGALSDAYRKKYGM